MRILAPAKINLTLRVLGKRPDGYHELESVMQLLTLADELVIDDADELRFTCSEPALENEQNLVMLAVRLLRERSATPRGAAIHLEKRIPAQAGLGGGSSDAAAVLAALNEFWEIRLPLDELTMLAGQLGSDVPFFLDGPCSVARGRGEEMTPVIHRTVCHVVVAKPSKGLPTPAVYAALDAAPLPGNRRHQVLPETQAMNHALQSGDPALISGALVNDLEGPALQFLPELYAVRERMLDLGCHGVLLCGSGSAVFGICPDAAVAAHAATVLTNECPWTWAGTFAPPIM